MSLNATIFYNHYNKQDFVQTHKFSDFLAVINFIHNPDMVTTHVGEVIVHAEEKD